MSKRVLFIFCNGSDDALSFPLGVGLLSAVLKKHGHHVKGLYIEFPSDGSADLETVCSKAREFSPDLICYSATSPAFEYVRTVAATLQPLFRVPSLCGGMHPTLYPSDALAAEGIDYICIGEGERPIVDFVENIDKGEQYLLQIPGIWKLDGKGSVLSNKIHPLEQNLDRLPFIDYDVFGKAMIDRLTKDGWLRFITSRGCPYSCSYCHNKIIRHTYARSIGCSPGKLGYVRMRSVDSTIAEILDIVSKYDIKVINFMDDLFCLDRERTLEFCSKFKARVPSDVGYSIQTHLKHLDREIVNSLADSRCIRVVVGVESANQRILGLLNRKSEPEGMERALRLLLDAKFPSGVWTLNILGNPTESLDEMLETLSFNARNLVNVCKFNFMAPYQGSDIHEFCKEKNLFDETYSKQRFVDRYVSVLKHAPKEAVFLERFFDIGHWYMNLQAPLALYKYYAPLIDAVERMDSGEWSEHKKQFMEEDALLSAKLSSENRLHYRFLYSGRIIGKVIGLTKEQASCPP